MFKEYILIWIEKYILYVFEKYMPRCLKRMFFLRKMSFLEGLKRFF